jgi:hypothetical protein
MEVGVMVLARCALLIQCVKRGGDNIHVLACESLERARNSRSQYEISGASGIVACFIRGDDRVQPGEHVPSSSRHWTRGPASVAGIVRHRKLTGLGA